MLIPNLTYYVSIFTFKLSAVAVLIEKLKNQIDKLAIPRIGCGIDGLEWDKVSALLEQVFGKEQVEIVVYNYVPPQ